MRKKPFNWELRHLALLGWENYLGDQPYGSRRSGGIRRCWSVRTMDDRIGQLCRDLSNENNPQRALELARDLNAELRRLSAGLRVEECGVGISTDDRFQS